MSVDKLIVVMRIQIGMHKKTRHSYQNNMSKTQAEDTESIVDVPSTRWPEGIEKRKDECDLQAK